MKPFLGILLSLLMTAHLTATTYVLEVNTKNNGMGSRWDHISHCIIKLKMWGTNGGPKTVSFYPNDKAPDIYWNATTRADLETAYTKSGDGEKENDSLANIQSDRNAFWKKSKYYFNFSGDLGHIYQIKAAVKSNSNASCKWIKVDNLKIYQGSRISGAKYRYDFSGTDGLKIEKTNFDDGNPFIYINGHTHVGEPQELPAAVVGGSAQFFGNLVRQDNVQGTGQITLTYEWISKVETTNSSEEEVAETFNISTEVTGTYEKVTSSIKSAYESKVTQKMVSSLSTSNQKSGTYSAQVNGGEYKILVGKYKPKTAKYQVPFTLTYFDYEKNKPVTETVSVLWTGQNEYNTIIGDSPEIFSFNHRPTKAEVLNILPAFINKEDLATEFPISY